WTLGVIAYQALTGRLPFKADVLTAILLKICMDPHTPPSSLVPDLDGAVDAFFDRALAKNPAQRFQSSAEMAIAFAALAGHAHSSGPSVAAMASFARILEPGGAGSSARELPDDSLVDTAGARIDATVACIQVYGVREHAHTASAESVIALINDHVEV